MWNAAKAITLTFVIVLFSSAVPLANMDQIYGGKDQPSDCHKSVKHKCT